MLFNVDVTSFKLHLYVGYDTCSFRQMPRHCVDLPASHVTSCVVGPSLSVVTSHDVMSDVDLVVSYLYTAVAYKRYDINVC